MGENCLVSMQRDFSLEEKKGENSDGTDFKMGVVATFPEISQWTLNNSSDFFLLIETSQNRTVCVMRSTTFCYVQQRQVNYVAKE